MKDTLDAPNAEGQAQVETSVSKTPSKPQGWLNTHQRLAVVKAKVDYIQKEQQKVDGKYRPVSYNAVIAKARPAFEAASLNFVTSVKSAEIIRCETKNSAGYMCTVTIKCHVCCADEPGDGFSFDMVGSGFDTLDKATSKAVTIAQKNAIMKLLLLESGDDEESKYEYEDPAPEKITTISREQVVKLEELLKKTGVSLTIALQATGQSGITSLDQITQANFQPLHDRLEKRYNELKAAGKLP